MRFHTTGEGWRRQGLAGRWPGMRRCASLVFLLALTGPVTFAQITSDMGEVAGTIRTADGAAVANAVMRLSAGDRGLRREARTEADGTFRFRLLPPGDYRIEAEAAGLVPRALDRVTVEVGETARVEFILERSETPTFSATVAVAAPPLDFDRTQQAAWIDFTQLDKLPINRRSYLDFALLLPGVGDTVIADSADFRPAVAPTSGLSIAGSNGRGNTFSIDGVENNGLTGGVRPSVPQAAVQEFQVNRSSFGAEYGGAFGGTLQIVTRSGANEPHGSVFGLLRDRALDASNFFDPSRSAYTRQQSGFGIGGPVRKDRAFFFAAFERLDRHETTFVPILSDRSVLSSLTPSQSAIVNTLQGSGSAALAGTGAQLAYLLNPSNNPLVLPLFNANSGAFPFSEAATQGSLRLDYRISDRQTVMWRGSVTADYAENNQFGALVAYNRGNNTDQYDGGMMLQDTLMLSPGFNSVTRVSFAYDKFAILPVDAIGPAIDIAGYGYFGRDTQYPFAKVERHYEGQQTFELQAGRHNLKFGGDLDGIRNSGQSNTAAGGDFTFAQFLPLGTLINTIAQNPNASAGIAAALAGLGHPELAANLNDPITSLQSFALGIPVYYLQGFSNPSAQVPPNWALRASAFVEDTWRPRAGLSLRFGLRAQSQTYESFPAQRFADPRFGFSWSPRNSSTWIVRGGFGLYSGWVDSQIVFIANAFRPPLAVNLLGVPITGLPGYINPATGAPVTAVDVWQQVLNLGILGRRTIGLPDLAPLGIQPGFQFPATGGLAGGYVSPGSQQGSLEIEHSIGSTEFSAAYNYQRTLHLPRARDANLYIAGQRPDGWPIFGHINPALTSNLVLASTGNSLYHALVLQARRRFRSWWSLDAYFTYSKAIDDVTDFTTDYAAQNQFDNRAERGPSLFNQKFRFTLTSVLQAPWGRGRTGFQGALVRGWTLSPIVQADSARPFNILTGYDNLGDGFTNTHRPLGLGRNAGIGPAYFSVDARLSRIVRLRPESGLALEFTAEAFNALNHVNFDTVNNIVGSTPVQGLPHPLTGRVGPPTEPFSFVSARDPRQIQLGLKVAF